MPSRRTNDTTRLLTLGSRYGFLPLVWWEMYWATLETVGYRVAQMAAAGMNPNASQRRENLRMVQEKAEAGMEMATALARPNPALPIALGQQWWDGMRFGLDASGRMLRQPQNYLSLAWSWPLLMAESAADAVDTAIHPWHRRVTANARRLRKRRR